MAYGERLMVDKCVAFLMNVKNPHNRQLMETVFRIWATDAVNQNMSFYLLNGAVSAAASA